MELQQFIALTEGREPTLDDYSEFVALAERLPVELLWQLLCTKPKMHWMLRDVVNKNLQERIPKINIDASLNSIATELKTWKNRVDWEEHSRRIASAPVSMKHK